MEQSSVIHLICAVRQVNGMLQILDAEKNNPSITLGEIHRKFEKSFGVNPESESFYFYSQHQFITSMLAYLCMPSEKFYDELPEASISTLPFGWGLELLSFNGSLKELVRHLRNSVSHGNMSVNEELLFAFHNRGAVVVLNHRSLQSFCRALAYWCITKDVGLKGLSDGG